MTHLDASFEPYFETAERLLTNADPVLHPVMGKAIAEFARLGAGLPSKHVRVPETVDGPGADELLTTSQAARRLGVSDKHIYRLVHREQLRSYVVDRRHRFRASDIVALIDASSRGTRAVRAARQAADGRRAA